MTTKLNKTLLFLVSILTCAALLVSCEKDNDEKNSGLVELHNFGPTGAQHGDTIRFFGANLDKVTAIHFTGNGAVVDKSEFKSQTNELIKVIVPTSAEKGYVTLKAPQGDVVSKTQFNLNVLINIASMTESARPGSNITLTGSYLNWVKSVTFADDKLVETFVAQSFDQLVVTVPEDAKTGTLILAYGGTDSANLETSAPLDVVLPKATGISPNPIKHAQNLTITGTDLDLVKKVYIPGSANAITSFVSQSATQLVVTIPGYAVRGNIQLEAASGEKTTSADELVLTLPDVTNMTPNPVDPGADLTITGSNLDLVTSIAFENASPVTDFVSQSATQIVVNVPMGVLRGQITMGVLNSTVPVKSTGVLEITGTAPPPVIALPIYDDAVTNNWLNTGWIGGGWGGTADYNNSSPVREGFKSIKIDYVGGYGAPLQLGAGSINLGAYTHFKISIFGGPGSNGKRVNLGINGADAQMIYVVEGEWTDYAFLITDLTGAATLTDIILKEFEGAGGFTVYVDAIGLN